jgi:putative ABC transport system ATP-binding protein
MDAVIKLENINKSYIMGRQELQVLKGISLQIQRNDYVALMGPPVRVKVP